MTWERPRMELISSSDEEFSQSDSDEEELDPAMMALLTGSEPAPESVGGRFVAAAVLPAEPGIYLPGRG